MFTLFNPELARAGQELKERFTTFASGAWTDAELAVYQTGKLRQTVGYVQENSAFYRRHLAGVDAAGLTLDSLARVPFTTKDDLRREMTDLLSQPISKAWIFYETTGTTGVSTPCPRDNIDSLSNNMALTFYYDTIFRECGDSQVIGVAGPTELHSFGDTFGDVCRNLGLAVAKMWPHSPMVGFDRALHVMRTLPVTGLFCTPGMALSLAKRTIAAGLDPRDAFQMKVILCLGELASPSLLANIGSLWGARAYNGLYASQEASVLGAAGADGGLYAAPLLNIYEVIDPDTGLRVPAGNGGVRTGELVVTSLYQGSKPLVRYRTGDLVRTSPRQPGRSLPAERLAVLGRTRDTQVIGGHQISGLDLEDLLLRYPRGFLDYQIVIDCVDGADELTLRFEVPPGDRHEIDPVLIDAACQAELGVRVRVEYGPLGAVTTTGAMVSWKAARIVDLRQVEQDAESLAALSIASGRS
jgi:phenylacetate-CoA ligase